MVVVAVAGVQVRVDAAVTSGNFQKSTRVEGLRMFLSKSFILDKSRSKRSNPRGYPSYLYFSILIQFSL